LAGLTCVDELARPEWICGRAGVARRRFLWVSMLLCVPQIDYLFTRRGASVKRQRRSAVAVRRSTWTAEDGAMARGEKGRERELGLRRQKQGRERRERQP
jgi:hypothetical protein